MITENGCTTVEGYSWVRLHARRACGDLLRTARRAVGDREGQRREQQHMPTKSYTMHTGKESLRGVDGNGCNSRWVALDTVHEVSKKCYLLALFYYQIIIEFGIFRALLSCGPHVG